jgi:hypothetical protein
LLDRRLLEILAERLDIGSDMQRLDIGDLADLVTIDPGGLTRLVAQETIDPFLAVPLLPAPNGRAADAGLIGNLQDWQTLGRKENDPRPLHVLEREPTVAGDGEQTLAILSCEDDVDGLGHAARLAHPAKFVNPVSVSVH